MRTKRVIQTVDSHTEGNPTRVVVGGIATPPGKTLQERCDWLRTHDDRLRQLLNFEPRGSAMMCSAIVMAPIGAANFSVLLLEQDEYVPMCGHCMIGVATTVVETGMVSAAEGSVSLAFETLAGVVTAVVHVRDGSVTGVTLQNVGSFLLEGGLALKTRDLGEVRTDIAFGGDFYAIVDADALGLDLSPANEAAAAHAAAQIIAAVNNQVSVVHPDNPSITRCYETLFTTNKVMHGNFRHAVVSPPGAYDRSPCGTGTSARLALMYANGQIGIGQPTRFEGVLGTFFEATITSVEERPERTIVHPAVTGRAYLTGFHSFLLDPTDPFPGGYRIGPQARVQT
jgi:proline racemase